MKIVQNRPMKPFKLYATMTCVLLIALSGCVRQSRVGLVIDDPYADVDWANAERHRANLHTHTTVSDGLMNPHTVVDLYHEMGYTVLAITDHNAVTYPWTNFSQIEPSERSINALEEGRLQTDSLDYEDRDPDALGMIAIQGNELSSHHHTGSFFNDHNNTTNIHDSLIAVAEKEGMAMLYHPGRYNMTTEWYADLYLRYPHLFGMEVYNQGDRYPGDREIWDNVLSVLMPDRPVWGHSNDDMHGLRSLGLNYNVFLLPSLSKENIRHSLMHGESYFVYSPVATNRLALPYIDAITVDHRQARIVIHSEGEHETLWISEGREVARGNELNLTLFPDISKYVRAELRGEHEVVVGTQPFALHRPVRVALSLPKAPGEATFVGADQIVVNAHFSNVSSETVRARLVLSLEGETLEHRRLRIAPGETVVLPVTLPIDAINADKTLKAKLDLGSAYGKMRNIAVNLPLALPEPVSVSIETPSVRHSLIQLHNALDEHAYEVEVEANLDGQTVLSETVALEPGSTASVKCPLPTSLKGATGQLDITLRWPQDISPTRGNAHFAVDLESIVSIPAAPVPELAALEASVTQPQFLLNSLESVMPIARRDRWDGEEDLSASLYWGWDEDQLWVAALVRDDKHINEQSGEDLWDGDTFQIAFAREDGRDPSNLAFALTPEGKQVQPYGLWSDTLIEHTRFEITRDDESKTTRYLVVLPLDKLGITASAGTLFRMSAVVFDDDDGEGYDCWMQITPGIAGGWNPLDFLRVVLEQEGNRP